MNMKKYTGSKTQDTFFIEQFISNLCTNYFNKNNSRQEFLLRTAVKLSTITSSLR